MAGVAAYTATLCPTSQLEGLYESLWLSRGLKQEVWYTLLLELDYAIDGQNAVCVNSCSPTLRRAYSSRVWGWTLSISLPARWASTTPHEGVQRCGL